MWPQPLVLTDWVLCRGIYDPARLAIFLDQARNLQEFINSTTGVILAPNIKLTPHQIIGTCTINGTDVFFPLLPPS